MFPQPEEPETVDYIRTWTPEVNSNRADSEGQFVRQQKSDTDIDDHRTLLGTRKVIDSKSDVQIESSVQGQTINAFDDDVVTVRYVVGQTPEIHIDRQGVELNNSDSFASAVDGYRVDTDNDFVLTQNLDTEVENDRTTVDGKVSDSTAETEFCRIEEINDVAYGSPDEFRDIMNDEDPSDSVADPVIEICTDNQGYDPQTAFAEYLVQTQRSDIEIDNHQTLVTSKVVDSKTEIENEPSVQDEINDTNAVESAVEIVVPSVENDTEIDSHQTLVTGNNDSSKTEIGIEANVTGGGMNDAAVDSKSEALTDHQVSGIRTGRGGSRCPVGGTCHKVRWGAANRGCESLREHGILAKGTAEKFFWHADDDQECRLASLIERDAEKIRCSGKEDCERKHDSKKPCVETRSLREDHWTDKRVE